MIKFFSRHPTAANLLMLGLLVLGFTSLSTIKRETFPEYDPPYIMAGIAYPALPLKRWRRACVSEWKTPLMV